MRMSKAQAFRTISLAILHAGRPTGRLYFCLDEIRAAVTPGRISNGGAFRPTPYQTAQALGCIYGAISALRPNDNLYAYADELRNGLLGVDDIEPILEAGGPAREHAQRCESATCPPSRYRTENVPATHVATFADTGEKVSLCGKCATRVRECNPAGAVAVDPIRRAREKAAC